MVLIIALIVILTEAIGESLIKKRYPDSFIFEWWVQWIIAIALFVGWFIWALHFDKYYVPVWKIITGFIFVRFAIFDIAYNLTSGLKWNYYGTTKLYDRIMIRLGGWGWWIKLCLGIIGGCFLLGWD